MEDKLRTFIAIELPEELQKKICYFIDTVKSPEDKITWVLSKNIHLTLKFLGYISIKDIDSVKDILQDVAGRYSPFDAVLRGGGVFPSQRSPRIIWIGIDAGGETLKDIYNDIEAGVESIGLPKEERSFTPHITVGRVKYIKDMNGFGAVITKHKEDLFGNLKVDSISLIKSTLSPKGAVYENLFNIPLSGRRNYG